MCPFTEYWDLTISSIVAILVNDYNVSGVYIDQIGAASAILCLDPSHHHSSNQFFYLQDSTDQNKVVVEIIGKLDTQNCWKKQELKLEQIQF